VITVMNILSHHDQQSTVKPGSFKILGTKKSFSSYEEPL